MLYYLIVAIILLFLPMAAFGQSAVSDCNAPASGENCLPPSSSEFASFSQFTSSSLVDPVTGPSSDDTLPAAPAPQPSISGTIKPDASGSSSEGKKESFRWGRALKVAGTFLVIEQAWVVHTDFPWVVS
ncbi:MAG: hypothetical protein WAK22_14690, partial [Candidatus Sulfotelmatobacter sp.]